MIEVSEIPSESYVLQLEQYRAASCNPNDRLLRANAECDPANCRDVKT